MVDRVNVYLTDTCTAQFHPVKYHRILLTHGRLERTGMIENVVFSLELQDGMMVVSAAATPASAGIVKTLSDILERSQRVI